MCVCIDKLLAGESNRVTIKAINAKCPLEIIHRELRRTQTRLPDLAEASAPQSAMNLPLVTDKRADDVKRSTGELRRL